MYTMFIIISAKEDNVIVVVYLSVCLSVTNLRKNFRMDLYEILR